MAVSDASHTALAPELRQGQLICSVYIPYYNTIWSQIWRRHDQPRNVCSWLHIDRLCTWYGPVLIITMWPSRHETYIDTKTIINDVPRISQMARNPSHVFFFKPCFDWSLGCFGVCNHIAWFGREGQFNLCNTIQAKFWSVQSTASIHTYRHFRYIYIYIYNNIIIYLHIYMCVCSTLLLRGYDILNLQMYAYMSVCVFVFIHMCVYTSIYMFKITVESYSEKFLTPSPWSLFKIRHVLRTYINNHADRID